MLGSKNRDYKTGNRLIEAKVLVHKRKIELYMEMEKLDNAAASKRAYDEIVSGLHNIEIREEVARLKSK